MVKGLTIDLYNFTNGIENKIDTGPLYTWAKNLMSIIEELVIKEKHFSGHPNSHGLAIYLPKNEYNDKEIYEKMDISKNTHWDEFLDSYFNNSGSNI